MAVLSIVMPCYWVNEKLLEMTKQAIGQIHRCTETEYELILVDDGSLFRLIVEANCIRREGQGGFARAVNDGIKAAKSDYICVMNNDVFVTASWDKQLLQEAAEPEVGFAFPDFRHVKPALSALELARERNSRELETCRRPLDCDLRGTCGACFVSRREIYGEIGLLDDGYGLGGWEDKDLFARALEAGYRLRKCYGSFVVHVGNATANTIAGFWERQKENQERFEAAHGPIERWHLNP